MSNSICPFSGPLILQDFQCPYAREIIRRGGTEISCQDQESYTMCSAAHAAIKRSALQKMGVEDDLTQVSHNVYLKIQYGGLLGLQALVDDTAAADRIENIAALVAGAVKRYGDADNLPLEQISEAITNYKTRRRGKK